jgi:hypothetical protein
MWRRRIPSEEELQDRRIRKWAELWETIVLSLATLATVWAGYQAGQWNNLQTILNNEATILRIESSHLSAQAQKYQLLDIALFSDWVNAMGGGNQRLADFFRARFRDEFRPAFDAWLAARPLENAAAADSPFDMPEYHLTGLDEAERLIEEAEQRIQSAESAGSFGDQYTLSVVILAASLLLAGIANRFKWAELRAVVVVAALLVLLFSVINIIRLPIV